MALDFPSSPTNGQVFNQYVYNSTTGAWKNYNDNTAVTSALLGKANLAGGNTFTNTQTFNNYVLKPGQPSFHATAPDTSWANTTTNTDMTNFSVAVHNIGSHYNTSTGRFTAPVNGYYFFSISIFMYTAYANNTNTYWGLYKNGTGINVNVHGVQGQDGGQSISGVYYLAAGDYISIRHNSALSSWGGQFCSFNGYLLG